MKILLAFGVLTFALSFCNLAERIKQLTEKPQTTNTNSSTPSPTSSGDGTVEKYSLTPEQTNILNSGKEMKWNEQGMLWTVPSNWKLYESENLSLLWTSPDGASLIVSISPMNADFPVDISIKGYYDGAVTRKTNGEVEMVRYLELDGLKGVEFIETIKQGKDSPRRQQWIGFRKYNGQTQMVNIMLATKGGSFDKQRDTFAAVMSSTKMAQ